MDRIYEAMGELGAAISQSLPIDDQIIMEHVRTAHRLIQEEWRARQETPSRSERLEAVLRNLREYIAVEGRSEDGRKLIGLSYQGSDIWGPCFDPQYDPWELCQAVQKWLREKIDAALAAPREQACQPQS